MKKAVVIEGPDNLGKTTLAEMLKKEFSAYEPTIVHCSAPLGDSTAALAYQRKYLRHTIDSFKEENGFEIWDRSIIGECVYGPLYRDYDHALYEHELTTALLSISNRLFNVVLYTNGDLFKKYKIRAKDDEAVEYQKRETAPRIAIEFVDVFTRLGLKHTLYVNCENYESFDARNNYIMKRIRAWLHLKPYEHLRTGDFTHTFFNNAQMIWKRGVGFMKWRYECDDYTDEDCDLGNDHAKLSVFGRVAKRPTTACGATDGIRHIFIGEAPGQEGCGKLGIPFYDDRSGNLMQMTLDRLGIHPTQYYMTNAVKCCPEANVLGKYVDNQSRRKLECVIRLKTELMRIMAKNPTVKVIALGKVAGYELSRLGITHNVVYHPAYYLRMGIPDDFHRELKLVTEG